MLTGLFILLLFSLGLIVALAHWLRTKKKEALSTESEEAEEEEAVVLADMECCGQHETCEKESLLAAVSQGIEYYDDEELDRFRGRNGDEYTDEEADEFRNILYTMRSEEVAGWVRSLQLRMINLPDDLKDEVFLVVGEMRDSHGGHAQ